LGARYRRPAIPELDKYEGRGVIIGLRRPRPPGKQEEVVPSAGATAGQAIVFLASHAAHVSPDPRPDLAKSMSRYLIDCIGSLTNVTPNTESEIVATKAVKKL
jgi:thioredoxin reductase (NADPH)